MNQHQQAKQYIIACFQSNGFQPYFIVSKNALLKILDKLAQQQFNRDLAFELLERCPLDYQGRVKIEDFANILIEADIMLNQKIQQTNVFIEQQILNRQQLTYSSSQAQASHQIRLIVKVIGARNLYAGQVNITHKPYVVVHFGTEKSSTNLAHNDRINPEWNQAFTFKVRSGAESSYVSVLNLDESTKKTALIGEAHFSIAELQDQLKHNQWFKLYDSHGQALSGSILLELQLFVNEDLFYEEALKTLDQQIIDAQKEKTQFENDLRMIHLPFPQTHLQKPLRVVQPDAPDIMFVNELSKPIVYQGEKRVDLMQMKNPILTDAKVNEILNLPPDTATTVYANNAYPAEEDLKNKANYGFSQIPRDVKIILGLIGLYALGSLYLCFVKTDFLNITLALMVATIVCFNFFEKSHLNLFAVQLVLSCLYDAVWLAAYQDIWWGQHHNPQEADELVHVQRKTIIVNYVVMGVKVILSCFLWSLKGQISQLNENKQFGLGLGLYQLNSDFPNPFTEGLRYVK